jgi:hypothetical protein
VEGQLRGWVSRVVEVWNVELPPQSQGKLFVGKNGIRKLDRYDRDPGADFWADFPVNRSMEGKSVICVKKLAALGEKLGLGGNELLAAVCRDLEHGADIGCVGPYRAPTSSRNARSALEAGEQVTDAVASWIKKGFVAGPFDAKECPPDAKRNGLMCRPKPDGAVRVIMNMSAPKGACVNEGIDADLFPAVMSSTWKWVSVLNAVGRQCRIMKLDWADAYKHVPVSSADIKLQYFSWLGKDFVELCLVFGTSSSVGLYDRLAKLVLDMVLRVSRFPADWVCQHLDDVCAAAPADSDQLDKFYKAYRQVALQVGVRLAPEEDKEKAFAPCHEGTVLGVTYNTLEWTWAIPQDKLMRFARQLRLVMSVDQMRQGEIWSVAGRVMHYAPLIPTGRFNLDHIIRANGFSKDRDCMVPVDAALKRQCWFWYTLVLVCAGGARIPSVGRKLPPWTRECYTDAAGGTLEGVGRGVGAVSLDWWVYVPWPRKINCGVKAADGKKLSRKLSALELVGPLLCVTAGHLFCRGRTVRVWVDNIGSVTIWNKGYSLSCGLCTTLVKAIGTVAAGIGCELVIQKITRCSSDGAEMADALSKADFNRFRRTAGAAGWALQCGPARVSGHLLAWLANPVEDDQLGVRLLKDIAAEAPVLGHES